MSSQSKLDLIAAGAISAMFLGAFALTVTRWGLMIVAAGVVVMLLLLLKSYRTRP